MQLVASIVPKHLSDVGKDAHLFALSISLTYNHALLHKFGRCNLPYSFYKVYTLLASI